MREKQERGECRSCVVYEAIRERIDVRGGWRDVKNKVARSMAIGKANATNGCAQGSVKKETGP